MVNIYIVHSGKDYEYVKNFVEPYLIGQMNDKGEQIQSESYANILTMKSGKMQYWKREARKKIKMSHVVIVVLGEDSNDPLKKKTMGWEVQQAFKGNKQIMVINRNHYRMPDYMFFTDPYTSQKREIAKEQPIADIKKRIDDYAKGHYNIFSEKFARLDLDQKNCHNAELVEQYKMFQKTSEDLVARRQNINSFYITVNSALVSMMGIVIGVTDLPVRFFALLFMCITGIILAISWVKILDSYGLLNAAKMKVITLLEEQLPVALYETEWNIMSDKLNNKRYVSFTSSEKRVPRIFAVVYSVMMVISVGCLLF